LFVLALALVLTAASPAVARKKPVKADRPAPLPAPVWRAVDPEHTLVIDTNKGRIIAELTPQAAPQSVARIEQLVRMHFYDGLSFFRVIDDFMDQTGDPHNAGDGGSVLPNVPGEFDFKLSPGQIAVIDHPPGQDAGFLGALPVYSQPAAMGLLMADGKISAHITFCSGVFGMARADNPNSGNSQFFMMRQPRNALDEHYAAFGRVVVGEDVVRSIKTGEPVADPQDRMTRVQMLADMPEGVRPTVRVIDTKSAYFTALVSKSRADVGDSFGLCDVEVAGEAK
jgi:peptidylprolyl isomerase